MVKLFHARSLAQPNAIHVKLKILQATKTRSLRRKTKEKSSCSSCLRGKCLKLMSMGLAKTNARNQGNKCSPAKSCAILSRSLTK